MIDFSDVQAAYSRIQSLVKKTPLVHSKYLSDFCGGQVYLKLENQQITNSFKVRGAMNKLLSLTPEEKKKGVLAVSTGNHAQAIGVAAEHLKIPAKIIIPENTPENKIEKIKKYDVTIKKYDVTLEIYQGDYDETELYALKLSKNSESIFVSGYNDNFIAAGQGTIGIELADQLQTATDVLVPVGRGGLISGVAIAVKTLLPNTRVIGVQPDTNPAFYESLKAGKIIDVELFDSIADGISGGIEKGSITFDIVQKYVDEILLVKEETLKEAIKLLWKEDKQKVEGAAALAISPILEDPSDYKDKVIVAIISGGNIDEELFQQLIK
ncbi:MAG: threonine ammonia-lyase [Candidatus Heimdallarchaeota archaeon]